MSEPDRTLGNEPKHLRPEIQQILNDVAGTDPADWYRRNEAGIAIESLILEDRKALATALLEKGPKDLKLPFDGYVAKEHGEIKQLYAKAAINQTNAKWRSIIKEYLG